MRSVAWLPARRQTSSHIRLQQVLLLSPRSPDNASVQLSPVPLLHTLRILLLRTNQTLRRRLGPHNLPLYLAHAELRLQNPHHAQQPPRGVARLRAHADPVPRARHVQLDVFPRPAVRVARSWGLGVRVVGPEDFERATVARSAGGVLARARGTEGRKGRVVGMGGQGAIGDWAGRTYRACATTML